MTRRSAAVPTRSATTAAVLRVRAASRRPTSSRSVRRCAAREEASRDPDGRSMGPGYHRGPRKNPERFPFIDALNGAMLSGPAIFRGASGDLPEKLPSEGREEDAAASYRRAAPYLDASWQLI